MISLWADGWFYISALGFLGSGALFLYLLGQYRSAVEDVDENDAVLADGPLPAVTKVVELAPVPVSAPIVVQPQAKPEPVKDIPVKIEPVAPQPAVQPQAASPVWAGPAVVTAAPAGSSGPERRRSESTLSGGLSPAVVYLQNIKGQMEKFDKEISGLKSLAAQQAAQGELLLRRLAELAENIKTAAPPPRSGAPASAPEPIPEKAPAPVLQPAAPVPDKAPAASSPSSAVPAPVPEPIPEKAPAALHTEEKKTAETLPAKPEPTQSIPPEAIPSGAKEAEKKADTDATVVMAALAQQVSASIPPPASAPPPQPSVPATEPAPEQPSRPRKGPVWPV